MWKNVSNKGCDAGEAPCRAQCFLRLQFAAFWSVVSSGDASSAVAAGLNAFKKSSKVRVD
jgi:hypothetical protein